jgi:glycosyltransferase involved in cell wall biosynthesis
MLKVDLVYANSLSHKNGANSVIRQLVQFSCEFKNRGIDLTAFVDYGSTEIDENNLKNKSVRSWLKDEIKKLIVKMLLSNKYMFPLIFYIRYVLPAHRAIRKYDRTADKGNILFFHEIFTAYWYLRSKSANNCRRKIVLVLHTNGDTFSMIRGYYPTLISQRLNDRLSKIEEIVYSKVDEIVFVSKASVDLFCILHPNFKDKTSVVYNGFENKLRNERSFRPHEQLKFVIVGSINERKGQKRALEAIVRFRVKWGHLPDFKLTIVGDGSDYIEIDSFIKSNNLQSIVSLVGSTNKVMDILLMNDVFMLPSSDEGLPMAILEAMSVAMPIVSTRVGGIPELVIDSVNGFLLDCSSESLVDFFESLEKLNHETWQKMAISSRKMFDEKFSLLKMIQKYSELFRRLSA